MKYHARIGYRPIYSVTTRPDSDQDGLIPFARYHGRCEISCTRSMTGTAAVQIDCADPHIIFERAQISRLCDELSPFAGSIFFGGGSLHITAINGPIAYRLTRIGRDIYAGVRDK